MIKCDACGEAMVQRKATHASPYLYDESGLSNVHLVGIDVFTCPKCNEESAEIPAVGHLHEVIARQLVKKASPLKGEEIRFLRKHAGFPAKKFAALLDQTPENLSRVENGPRTKLGGAADRLARAVSIISTDLETGREVLLRVADQLEKKKGAVVPVCQLGFKLDEKNHCWKQVQIAA